MREHSREELQNAASRSHSFAELMRLLGYGLSHNSKKRIERLLNENSVDFSHFDKTWACKSTRIFATVSKVCPQCSSVFETRNGGKTEKFYCSRKCANAWTWKDEKIREHRISKLKAAFTGIKRKVAIPKPPRPPKEKKKKPYIKPTITSVPFNPPKHGYDKESCEVAVKYSTNCMDALRLLGKTPNSGNATHLKRRFVMWQIDISHFGRGADIVKNFSRPPSPRKERKRIADEKIFSENGFHSPHGVRSRYAKVFPPTQCSVCLLKDWMGKPLAFDMDHINGKNTDNRLENLRWLCPNCHRQTETHGSKRGFPLKRKKSICPDCGIKINRGSKRCRPCDFKKRKADRLLLLSTLPTEP